MTDVTPQQVLLKGADAIEQHGHIKEGYGAPDTGFCAMGALRYVVAGDRPLVAMPEDDRRLYRQARDLLGRSLGYDGFTHEPIVKFNDAPERTADEVIAAMRKAAEL